MEDAISMDFITAELRGIHKIMPRYLLSSQVVPYLRLYGRREDGVIIRSLLHFEHV